MDDNLDPVVGDVGGGVADATTTAEVVSQGETLLTDPKDVAKKLQELKANSERDIAAVKSTFQKSEHELKLKMEAQQKAYEDHLRELKLASMDEEQRKTYEAQESTERTKNFEAEAISAKQALAEREQKDQYRDFFVSVGIPLADLPMNQDLATFANTGFALMAKQTQDLKKRLAQLEKKTNSDDDEIPAPDVDTSKNKSSNGGNWKALVARYGSDERVWKAIESGELSPSVLPIG